MSKNVAEREIGHDRQTCAICVPKTKISLSVSQAALQGVSNASVDSTKSPNPCVESRHNCYGSHSHCSPCICSPAPICWKMTQSVHLRCQGGDDGPHLLAADAASTPITSCVSPPDVSESPSCTNRNTSATLLDVLIRCIYALVMCLVA